MAPLNSLDLFTGIGGITRALDGFCKPVAYCEVDEVCQEVLKNRMNDGFLPRAPLFSDVRRLSAKDIGRKKVDIIVGGWPCQDISAIGRRRGLSGERSGLIKEVFRLTDEFKPSALFLENVPLILKDGFDVLLEEFVEKRGYTMRWAVIPASAVGAHHFRKRWFCLLTKPGFSHRWSAAEVRKYTPFSEQWQKEDRVRMIVPTTMKEKNELGERTSMLGNSVVPDCVRAAFATLVSGLRAVPSKGFLMDLSKTRNGMDLVEAEGDRRSSGRRRGGDEEKPQWGFAYVGNDGDGKGEIIPVLAPNMARADASLTFDPRVFVKTAIGPVTNELVREPVQYSGWSTPRHSSHTSNVLTTRTIRDLPTQVRFEIKTPDHLREGVLNPQFVEWLMGYPKDWTRQVRSS
jgi:site-specific DNA-cytosine methylase